MGLTQIQRDNQIKPGDAYRILANDSTGKMSENAAITGNRAVASDVNGQLVASTTTDTELGYVHGVTSSIQAQINALSNGLSWKQPVLVATTAPLTQAYTQTSSTVLTETSASSGVLQNIDGYTPVNGDRILIKDETGGNAPNNGIYIVTNIGDGVSVPWVLTRSSDMNTWAEVPSAAVFAEEGTANADKAYVCTSDPGGTLGSTNITFVQFGAITSYSAGSGIKLSGNTFSITVDNSLTTSVSDPTLVVKEDAAGAIITGTSGIKIQLEASNPTLQISSNQLGVKLDAARAITTGASGIGVSVDNTTIDISSNSIEVKAGGITNTQVSASAAIAISKLSTGTNAQIIISNGSTNNWETISGDATLTNAGVVSISGGLSNHLSWNETPSGTIGGGNTAFTLAHSPAGTGADLMLFLNGLLQQQGGSNDYTISGTAITFNVAPESGSSLLATYQY
jgi:hypothetical protein